MATRAKFTFICGDDEFLVSDKGKAWFKKETEGITYQGRRDKNQKKKQNEKTEKKRKTDKTTQNKKRNHKETGKRNDKEILQRSKNNCECSLLTRQNQWQRQQ